MHYFDAMRERLERAVAVAKDTGVLHIEGEMDVPINQGIDAAYRRASSIAEDCGYFARMSGRSRLRIGGAYMTGEYVLDYLTPDRQTVYRVEYYEPICVDFS